MKINIEKIVYPGNSLSKVDGKILFTDHGLPGEEVEVSIIKEAKNFTQAQTAKVITSSPHRRQPRCSHYRSCSAYQYIDYPEQIKIKAEQLNDILRRQLKVDLPDVQFRPSPIIWGYRNKIKLKVVWNAKKPRFVYNRPHAYKRFVSVKDCSLSPELTNLFLKAALKTLTKKPFDTLKEIVVRENSKKELLVGLYHESYLDGQQVKKAFAHLLEEFSIAGLSVINQKEKNKVLVWGQDSFCENISDIEFSIGTGSFFQVNTSILPLLLDDLTNNLELNTDMVLADLYCGVGTFGSVLSSKVSKVIAVESDTENFFFMEKNIISNNIDNFDVHLSDCQETASWLFKKKIDVAIVDPPRKGLDSALCDTLVASGPETLVYISCDPATLTRDLKIILASYEIKVAYGYDFFPHTPHIEAMVILKRK